MRRRMHVRKLLLDALVSCKWISNIAIPGVVNTCGDAPRSDLSRSISHTQCTTSHNQTTMPPDQGNTSKHRGKYTTRACEECRRRRAKVYHHLTNSKHNSKWITNVTIISVRRQKTILLQMSPGEYPMSIFSRRRWTQTSIKNICPFPTAED